jgi:uncharacterized protein (DUF362 family)
MVKSLVVLKRVSHRTSLFKTITEIFEVIDQHTRKASVNIVLIKPNLCYYWDASTGETTDPMLVSAIIDSIRQKYGNPQIIVAESDASAMKIKYVFKMLGYERLAKKKSVQLMNLSEDERWKQDIVVGHRRLSLSFPRILKKADLIINVPKLKVGPFVSGASNQSQLISCSLKNLFGCLHEKWKFQYHPVLNEVLIAVNNIIKPAFTIVDGIIALTRVRGFMALGNMPFKLDLILAGTDRVAIDYVALKILGYNPRNSKLLRMAEKSGIGSMQNIVIKGDGPRDLAKNLPKGNEHFHLKLKLLLRLFNLYAKFTKDTIPSVLENA